MALPIALPRLSQASLADHDEAVFRADCEGHAKTPGPNLQSLVVYDSFEAAEPVWRALEAEGSGSVYQRFDWCKVWFETFHPGGASSSNGDDPARPLIVVVTFNERPAFLLPLYCKKVLLGMKRALFMGDKHANVRVPLMSKDPDAHTAVLEEARNGGLLERIGEALVQGGYADHLALEHLPQTYAGDPNPLTFGPCKKGLTLLFSSTLYEDFAALKTERRPVSSQRKQRKRLRMLQAIGDHTMVTIDDASELDKTLDIFFQQKAARLQHAQVHNAFDDANNEAFIRRLAHQSLVTGSRVLEIYALKVNGDTIAVAGGGIQGDRYSMGINSMTDEPRYVACSPGRISVDMAVEAFCAEGFHWFDLGLGENEYKRMWCSPVDLYDVCQALTLKGQFLVAVNNGVGELKKLVKSTPWAKTLAHRVKFHVNRWFSQR